MISKIHLRRTLNIDSTLGKSSKSIIVKAKRFDLKKIFSNVVFWWGLEVHYYEIQEFKIMATRFAKEVEMIKDIRFSMFRNQSIY